MRWQDGMSDTHVAAPHEGHVPHSGNVSQEPLGPQGLPGWLIAKFKEEALKRKEVAQSAERAAFRFNSRAVEREADAFLRKHGVKLAWKRGGKQIK